MRCGRVLTLVLLGSALVGSKQSVWIEGQILPSQEDTHFIVNEKDKILRIRKSEIPESERKKFDRVFAHVADQIPKSAIDSTWTLGSADRAPAKAKDVPDEIWNVGENVMIEGEVLYRLLPNRALLKSQSFIFELDTKKLDLTSLKELERTGQHVSIVSRADAITAVWSAH